MYTEFRQSPAFQQLLRQSGSRVEKLDTNNVAYISRMLLIPFLSRIILLRVENSGVLDKVKSLARQHRSIVVRVAPNALLGSQVAGEWETALRKFGYQADQAPIAPTKTILVNLQKGDSELLAQMKSKTRYNIHLAQRRGVETKVYEAKDLLNEQRVFKEFYSIYAQNCQRIGMSPPKCKDLQRIFSAFNENLFIVHAYLKSGEAGAVAAYFFTSETTSYQFNGTTLAGRHDFAADLVVWQGFLEAKHRGCNWFDFDGIYDERYPTDEDWKGFSHFKAGFGGEEVSLLGSYIKRWPFL